MTASAPLVLTLFSTYRLFYGVAESSGQQEVYAAVCLMEVGTWWGHLCTLRQIHYLSNGTKQSRLPGIPEQSAFSRTVSLPSDPGMNYIHKVEER